MSEKINRYYRKPERETGTTEIAKQRLCLMCAKRFDSAWAGERICPLCKGKSLWRASLGA